MRPDVLSDELVIWCLTDYPRYPILPRRPRHSTQHLYGAKANY